MMDCPKPWYQSSEDGPERPGSRFQYWSHFNGSLMLIKPFKKSLTSRFHGLAPFANCPVQKKKTTWMVLVWSDLGLGLGLEWSNFNHGPQLSLEQIVASICFWDISPKSRASRYTFHRDMSQKHLDATKFRT